METIVPRIRENNISLIMHSCVFIMILSSSVSVSGSEINCGIMNSPPTPPAQSQFKSLSGSLPDTAVILEDVPTSTWTYGCTATAAGMLFGYYDRTGYPSMYKGPCYGGLVPVEDLGQGIYSPILTSCSIIATQSGFDGRTNRGHVDDYWISYNSPGPDPWVGNWPEHSSDCVADFLGTNLWKYDYQPWGGGDGSIDSNYDGWTWYFSMDDGTRWYDPPYTGLPRGLRSFAESRGYTVQACYSQLVDCFPYNPGGFTFTNYMAEIDARRPVLFSCHSYLSSSSAMSSGDDSPEPTPSGGHTIVGIGYDEASQTVYLHDGWYNTLQSMTWGGTYSTSEYILKCAHILQVAPSPEHAQVVAFEPPTGPYQRGEQVNTTVRVKNTGSMTRSFWVGLSFQEPGATLEGWPEGWFDIFPQQTRVLSPNEEETIAFEFDLPGWMPPGQYTAHTAIWDSYYRTNHIMNPPEYDRKILSSFELSGYDTESNSILQILLNQARRLKSWNNLEGDLWARYKQKEKIQFYFAGSYNIGFGVGATVLLDLDDLLGVTAEGQDGYVTVWVDENNSVFSRGLGVSFGLTSYVFDDADTADIRRDGEFELGYLHFLGVNASLLKFDDMDLDLVHITWNWDFEMEVGVFQNSFQDLVQFEVLRSDLIDVLDNAYEEIQASPSATLPDLADILYENIRTVLDDPIRPSTPDDGNWRPNTPTNCIPEDGASGISTSPIFWASKFDDPDAETFESFPKNSHFQLDTSTYFTAPLIDNLSFGGESWEFRDDILSFDTLYYWRVCYQDWDDAWSDWSNPTSFRTIRQAEGTLEIGPIDDFESHGTIGGPFNPSNREYTLTNAGDAAIDWSIGCPESWVSISNQVGSLDIGETKIIAITINGNANSLPAGTYTADVSFTNTTNHNGDRNVFVVLDIASSGNIKPTAKIDLITPNPTLADIPTVNFMGTGNDPDGTVIEWEWKSNLDGLISRNEDFTMFVKDITDGLHTIEFKVKDNSDVWSNPDTATLMVVRAVATPTFSPDEGTHTSPVDVTITCGTSDATIHYTTNGVDPTESDPVVASGGTVSVDHTLTLKAKAWKSGWNPSGVKSADYIITMVATPTFLPDGGTYSSPVDVTIGCATPDATIHYTTNGVDPTESDPVVASGGTVSVDHTLTLKAKAWKSGWNPSGIATAIYSILDGIQILSEQYHVEGSYAAFDYLDEIWHYDSYSLDSTNSSGISGRVSSDSLGNPYIDFEFAESSAGRFFVRAHAGYDFTCADSYATASLSFQPVTSGWLHVGFDVDSWYPDQSYVTLYDATTGVQLFIVHDYDYPVSPRNLWLDKTHVYSLYLNAFSSQGDSSWAVTNLSFTPNVLYVDVNSPNDPGSGTQEDPCRHIQDGIDVATGGDEVHVAGGEYLEAVTMKDGVNIHGGYDSSDWNAPRDCNANETIISWESPIVTIIDSNVTIDGFIIQSGWGYQNGGGIYCASSSGTAFTVRIFNNIIQNNTLDRGYGAGIYCDSYVKSVIIGNIIQNNTISEMDLSTAGGGGIYCAGTGCEISGNVIVDNQINSWYGEYAFVHAEGGGIWVGGGKISDNTVSRNSVQATGHWGGQHYVKGGGIYCNGPSTVIRNLVEDNVLYCRGGETESGSETSEAHGGGIYAPNSEITRNIVKSNTCSGEGGYVWQGYEDGANGMGFGGGTYAPGASLVNNLVVNNGAIGKGGNGGSSLFNPGDTSEGGDGIARGGGIYAPGAVVINNTVADNQTTASFGKGYVYVVGNDPNYDGTAISEAAGIYSDNSTMISNTIIWGNSPDQLIGQDCNNVTYCDISDGTCGGQNDNISANPLFIDPNRGDYHLPNGSPCIDAGDNNTAVVFSDITSAFGNTTTIIVADVNDYFIDDEIEYDNDGIMRTVVDVNTLTGAITFDQALENASELGKNINNYGQGDIDGDDRILFGGVDIGADEFAALHVSASSPHDPGLGTTDDPYRRIQDAIDAAGDGIKINVGVGTYYENIIIDSKNITLINADPNDPNVVASTIIDGTSTGSAVTTSDANITIDGFTITNGLAENGGGVYCEGSNVELSNCLVTRNRTVDGQGSEDGDGGPGGNGAGIYCTSAGSLTISNSVISDNTTGDGGSGGGWGENAGDGGCGGGGAGICCTELSQMYIVDCLLSNNTTGCGGWSEDATGGSGGDGAAICAGSSCSLEMHGSILRNNTTGYGNWGDGSGGGGSGGCGGGIYCESSSLDIFDCIIQGNATGDGGRGYLLGNGGYGGCGAGIYAGDSSVVTFSDCNVSSNSTGSGGGSEYLWDGGQGGSGGGIYCIEASTLTTTNCTISANTTGLGGEVWDYGDGGAGGDGAGVLCSSHMVLVETTVSNNIAGGGGEAGWSQGGRGGSGGGIYAMESSSLLATDCAFNDNVAGNGGRSSDGYGDTGGYGGGICCSSAMLENCAINRNMSGNGGYGEYGHFYATGGHGGGLFCTSGEIDVLHCEITGNATGSGGWSWDDGAHGGSGGGIYCASSATLSLAYCTIADNRTGGGSDASGAYDPSTAGDGGNGAGTLCSSGTIHNCIIIRNVTGAGGDGDEWGYTTNGGSGGSGAGVFCSNTTIENCTIAHNTAGPAGSGGGDPLGTDGADGRGAGLCANSGNIVTNTVSWHNSPDQFAGPDCVNVTYCNLGNGTCVGGLGNISQDPAFADPSSGDYRLQYASPCIDAGDPYYVAEPNETDLDGNPRIANNLIDMGAYESTPPVDSDGDGIYDHIEVAWGLDPNSTDTDGDGLTDAYEVSYDGDPSTYVPYDPGTGTGTDLNANSPDTDGDGHSDFQELIHGSSPIDGTSLAEIMTIHVDNDAPGDPEPNNPSVSDPDEDGSSEHPFDSIQEAIDVAVRGDEVRVAEGWYNESVTAKDNVNLYGGYDSTNWSLPSDPNVNETIIDANGLNDSVVHIVDANVIIDGFVITNGLADEGGGIYAEGGTLAIDNCIILNNSTNHGDLHPANGGGIYLSSSWAAITNCTIMQNNTGSGYSGVDGGAGGGICLSSSWAAITNCTIMQNNTGSGHPLTDGGNGGNGGGVFCEVSSLTVADCVITGNVTGAGGSGYPGAHGGDGGGIYIAGTYPVEINNSIISGNGTGDAGHGIDILESGGNGGDGGGVYCSNNLHMANCVVTGNTTGDGGYGGWECWPEWAFAVGGDGGDGGGIYCGSGTLNNCTIVDNHTGTFGTAACGDGSPGSGDAIYGSITVSSSIVWGNDAEQLAGCDCNNIYYSDIGNSVCHDGIGNISVDPCFVDGTIGDYHLKSEAGRWDTNSQTWVFDHMTSLCIDAGDPNSPVGDEPDPNGGLINMGAYGGTPEASKSYFGTVPVIISPACTAATAGVLYNCDVDASGIPEPNYSLVTSPAGMTIDSGTGLMSWTPTAGQLGSNPVEVLATNSAGSTSQSFAITVAGIAPVITSPPLTAATAGVLYNFDVDASGIPDPNYSLITSPSGMTIDSGTGLISWTPAADQLGPNPVTVRATNSAGFDDDSFNIIVSGVAPVITSTAVTVGIVNQSYIYDVDASGIPDPNYSLVTSPSGMTINSTTGVITWTPTAGQLGLNPVTVRATNSEGSNDQSFNIDVAGIAPVIISTAVMVGTVEQLYSYDVDASGIPEPNYSLITSPAGMTINSTTGVITWTPTAGQLGSNPVTVRATNSEGSDDQSYSIDVAGIAPVITSTAVTVGIVNQSYSYDVDASGIPDPNYSLITSPSGMTIAPTTGVITWTPTATQLGLNPVTVRATNSEGSDDQSYNIDVAGIAPAITSTPTTVATVGQLYAYDVDASGIPDPNYSLVTSPSGMTIAPTTGVITWTPTAGQLGLNPVTVRATNSEGTDDQSFSFSVFAIPGMTIHVDDDAASDPGPNDPCLSDPDENGSTEHPFDSIQEAIDIAVGGVAIIVYNGAYHENLNLAGKNIVLSSADPNDPNVVADTIINGNRIGTVVTFAGGESPDCLLIGFTIEGGNAEVGGGIYCYNSSPTISKCVISSNWADYGGGVCNHSADSTMVNCILSGNWATISGGGVYNIDCNIAPLLINCTLSGNLADSGGGVYCANSSGVTIANCIISGNQTNGNMPVGQWTFDEQQGMIAGDTGTGGNDCNLVGDTAWVIDQQRGSCLDFDGDGDYIKSEDTTNGLDFAPGSFSAAAWINTRQIADGWYRAVLDYDRGGSNWFTVFLHPGGGFHFRVGRDYEESDQILNPDEWYLLTGTYDSANRQMNLYINGQFDCSGTQSDGFDAPRSSKLTMGDKRYGNDEYFDGKIDDVRIYNFMLSPDEVQTLFEESGGGGIYCRDSSLTIANSTITANSTSDKGGGVYCWDSDVAISNCILWNNSVQQIYTGSGTLPIITYSDIQYGWPGEGNIDEDPDFVELAHLDTNGTPSDMNDDFWVDGDYHIVLGSPCIDAGDPNFVSDCNDVDIDGDPRVIDYIIDIGADENRGCELCDLNGNGNVSFGDYAVLADYWMEIDCTELEGCEGSDFDGRDGVTFIDLRNLANCWLWQSDR